MLRYFLILALLLPFLSSAQEDTTGISFHDVIRLRQPTRSQVDSMIKQLRALPGIKLDSNCFQTAYDLLEKYKAEDLRQRKKFVNQANSYAAGWREKVPGRCGAGGPPPICPVDHWFRAGVLSAMAEYHAIHKDALEHRLDELWRTLDRCILERPLKVRSINSHSPVIEKTYDLPDIKTIHQK